MLDRLLCCPLSVYLCRDRYLVALAGGHVLRGCVACGVCSDRLRLDPPLACEVYCDAVVGRTINGLPCEAYLVVLLAVIYRRYLGINIGGLGSGGCAVGELAVYNTAAYRRHIDLSELVHIAYQIIAVARAAVEVVGVDAIPAVTAVG